MVTPGSPSPVGMIPTSVTSLFMTTVHYDYCRPPSDNAKILLNLSDPNSSDTQCAFNRTGQLCGCCKDGYSLTLGGSECKQCSNTWLVLTIPFALAGIALVLMMMVCNLTLATGAINGPLFYANILITNRFVFFPQHKLSIPLQVCVSMLGLNLGITTCFYDGLDGLGKIFMQIAFETYLIFLMIIVVLSGRNRTHECLISSTSTISTHYTLWPPSLFCPTRS